MKKNSNNSIMSTQPVPVPPKPDPPPVEPPRKSAIHKLFFITPTVDEKVMNRYRQQVTKAQEVERIKKEKKRTKRAKKKHRQKERLDILAGKKPSHGSARSSKSHPQPMFSQQEPEGGNLYTIEDKENASQDSSFSGSEGGGGGGGRRRNKSVAFVVPVKKTKKDDDRYLKFLDHTSGPSHFSALDKEQDLLQKYKEKRKRRISQLYTGEVYHHELTYIWDHLKDRTKFYDKLDELTRLNFPLTPEIIKKMDKIKAKKEKKALRKQMEKDGTENCWRKIIHRTKNGFLKVFGKTNIGYVFKTTPRYYKMTPVTPIHCRRCRNLLEDTLEARWTPIGISFAVLFPIFGLLCCLSYREFVCVVCEEIYMYGDYPSRCRPLDKSKLAAETHVRFKRRSFNKNWNIGNKDKV